VTNSTLLVSQLPTILSSRVESFSVRKYDENGEKQRKGMLTVLEMLREKYEPSSHSGIPGLSVAAIPLVFVADVQWLPSLGDFGIALVYLYLYLYLHRRNVYYHVPKDVDYYPLIRQRSIPSSTISPQCPP
jgi:hypothetical protein